MRTRREIEEKVASLLHKHSVSEPPVPVEAITQQEGIRIVQSAFSGDVSGALLRSNGIAGIAVNTTQPLVRKRFTIAHELAHYLLDHRPDEDHLDWEFTVLRRDDQSAAGTDFREIEANAFAANLLMPKDFLMRDLRRFLNRNGVIDLPDSERAVLARRYKVSELAMSIRLANLGFVSPV